MSSSASISTPGHATPSAGAGGPPSAHSLPAPRGALAREGSSSNLGTFQVKSGLAQMLKVSFLLPFTAF
ncbi:hypothetical protein M422DRAFT_252231 [Sphaerobolus stellatus SS14]|uniref:Uncharacterized protein n=1 Tax=Sphaerobolus stellatus (strain SS14) TaxID=990650 RepID=A0A0C9VYU9_SPHS4|nr:hypothetical protein M422DRAFT_252231 [Sphaerobolus stellatus SS14]